MRSGSQASLDIKISIAWDVARVLGKSEMRHSVIFLQMTVRIDGLLIASEAQEVLTAHGARTEQHPIECTIGEDDDALLSLTEPATPPWSYDCCRLQVIAHLRQRVVAVVLVPADLRGPVTSVSARAHEHLAV